MLGIINNFSYSYRDYNYGRMKNVYNFAPRLQPLLYDTVQFTGKSKAGVYRNTFDYMAACILDSKKKYGVSSALLSAKKIRSATENLFESSDIFENYELCDKKFIKWKSYIPEDVRTNSVDKINQARKVRFTLWKEQLLKSDDSELSQMLDKNSSLKLVIWDAVTSEVKYNNRHIPVPYDALALKQTISFYNNTSSYDRDHVCATKFIDLYSHKLRDNLLNSMNSKYDSDEVWVKIPSKKHDPKNFEENIKKVEILSNRNWCTRSSVDKAEAALEDGDFYIYLKRNKATSFWEPLLAMTKFNGKIDQIQGKTNDNMVPINLLPELKSYISNNNLKLRSGISAEGPRALQAILIAEKLKEVKENEKFAKAIIENNTPLIFDFLNVPCQKIGNSSKLKIKSYNPVYNFDKNRGIIVPYSMFGIDEDKLLENVKIIEGNLVLCNKSKFNSTITQFPPDLQKVEGYIVCSQEQYKKYKRQMLKVVSSENQIIITHNY